MNCKKIQYSIINKKINKEIQKHILQCSECSLFYQRYEFFINALNSEYEPSLNIGTISMPATRNTKRSFIPSRRLWIYPAAVAAIIILSLPIIFFYTLTSKPYTQSPKPCSLIITTTPDGLLLTWKNSNNSKYIIYRSTNPKDFSKAEKIIVKGNKYLDKEADKYPLIFYRIYKL